MINSTWFVLECGAKIERFALYRRLTGTRIRTPYIYINYIYSRRTTRHQPISFLRICC